MDPLAIMDMLELADPEPPPGAPPNFPVNKISRTGLRLFLAPPYSRQDPNEPLTRGIGIKIRKPTTWIDEKTQQQQTWDDEWEERYPAWDCSRAGLFDLFESGHINQLTYMFQWKLPGDHEPPVVADIPLKCPAFGMPITSTVPLPMAAWARDKAVKNEELFSRTHQTDHWLKGSVVIPARFFNECQPGTVNETDFGLIGDKVTIQLPRLRPDCPMALQKLKDAGHYIPCGQSLYGKTEKSIGFEYRTQLLGAELGTAHTIDPAHCNGNVQFENLWFVLLNPGELPTYHFWKRPDYSGSGNRIDWPLSFYDSREQPVNRTGNLRRVGAIHQPIESPVATSWGPSDDIVISRTAPVIPPLEQVPFHIDFITQQGNIQLSDYDTPQDQDAVIAPPPVRYQKAVRFRIDPAFQPSPTTDLFSHIMTTRGRVNIESAREDSLSPVEKRKPKPKAPKSKKDKVKDKGKTKTETAAKSMAKSKKAATREVQLEVDSEAAPASPSTTTRARKPAKPKRTTKAVQTAPPSPRRLRSGALTSTMTSRAGVKKSVKTKVKTNSSAKAKSKAKSKSTSTSEAEVETPCNGEQCDSAEAAPAKTTRSTRKRKADQITEEEGTEPKACTGTKGVEPERGLRRSKRVRTVSSKAQDA